MRSKSIIILISMFGFNISFLIGSIIKILEIVDEAPPSKVLIELVIILIAIVTLIIFRKLLARLMIDTIFYLSTFIYIYLLWFFVLYFVVPLELLPVISSIAVFISSLILYSLSEKISEL